MTKERERSEVERLLKMLLSTAFNDGSYYRDESRDGRIDSRGVDIQEKYRKRGEESVESFANLIMGLGGEKGKRKGVLSVFTTEGGHTFSIELAGEDKIRIDSGLDLDEGAAIEAGKKLARQLDIKLVEDVNLSIKKGGSQ